MNQTHKILLIFAGIILLTGAIFTFVFQPWNTDSENTDFKPEIEATDFTTNDTITTQDMFTYIERHDESSYTLRIERQVDTSTPPQFQSIFGTVSRSNKTYYIIETTSQSGDGTSVKYYHKDDTTHVNHSELETVETRTEPYNSTNALRTAFIGELLNGLTYKKQNTSNNSTLYTLRSVSDDHPLKQYQNRGEITSQIIITKNSIKITYRAKDTTGEYIHITGEYKKLRDSGIIQPDWI